MASPSTTVLVVMMVACSIVIIACSAQQFYASGRYGKRGASTFYGGSRYGRSGGRRPQAGGGGSQVEVAARNDRFFIGSRYGKRAEETAPAESSFNELAEVLLPEEHEGSSQVTCLYTGVTNLYRCFNRSEEVNSVPNHNQ